MSERKSECCPDPFSQRVVRPHCIKRHMATNVHGTGCFVSGILALVRTSSPPLCKSTAVVSKSVPQCVRRPVTHQHCQLVSAILLLITQLTNSSCCVKVPRRPVLSCFYACSKNRGADCAVDSCHTEAPKARTQQPLHP